MILKPHSVALRLTPEEYQALVHVQQRDGDKTLAITLRKVVEPLFTDGAKSLKAFGKKEEARLKRIAKEDLRKKEEARLKRLAKKAASNGVQ